MVGQGGEDVECSKLDVSPVSILPSSLLGKGAIRRRRKCIAYFGYSGLRFLVANLFHPVWFGQRNVAWLDQSLLSRLAALQQ